MADVIAPDVVDVDVDASADEEADELLESELLVEDVSIDGMCGVY
jgi:mycofactocin precursor